MSARGTGTAWICVVRVSCRSSGHSFRFRVFARPCESRKEISGSRGAFGDGENALIAEVTSGSAPRTRSGGSGTSASSRICPAEGGSGTSAS